MITLGLANLTVFNFLLDPGGANYGVGYFSPKDCDDIWIYCEYIPQPAFKNLQYAYKHAKVYTDGSTLDNFTTPKDRQGRTTCPEKFKSLSSFSWTTDGVKDIKCPAKGKSSNFQCPANLNDLRIHPEKAPMKPFTVLCIKIFLILLGLGLVFLAIMFIPVRLKRRREESTWMTVVVPNVNKRGEEGDSVSDESAGLLSMKGWNYFEDSSAARYQSIGSLSSDEEALKHQR